MAMQSYPPNGSCARSQHTADNATLIRPTCYRATAVGHSIVTEPQYLNRVP